MRSSFLASAAVIAIASLSLTHSASAEAVDSNVARQHYEDCRWPTAFEMLSRLADAGDGVAARIAALMVRFGPALYGQPFTASSAQLAHWRKIAVLQQDDAS